MAYRYHMMCFIFVLVVHLGTNKDLSGLGEMSTVHHIAPSYYRDASKSIILVKETIDAKDEYFYFAFRYSPFFKFSENHLFEITHFQKSRDKTEAIFYDDDSQGLENNCRLATLRIVNGFFFCQIFSESGRPEIVKVTKSGLRLKKRDLQDSKIRKTPNDIHIMVDENGIWILYEGDNHGILEQISIDDLSSRKRIHIESRYVKHHAIVVSNKLYILSTKNSTLAIIKAIDIENPKNTMSYKVILSEKFPENSWIHYNPKFKQLFVAVSKNKTYIYAVEYCQFQYPNSKSIDFSKINSTFVWSLLPYENQHYIDLINLLILYFQIKDHPTLIQLRSVLITCPHKKCLMPGMSNTLICRINTIKLLFESFAKQKINNTSFNPLQVHLDMYKLLEQSKFRILSSKLNGLKHSLTKTFIHLKKEIQSFRSVLGSYFISISEFDNRKYQADIELIYSIFNELNTKQQIIAPIIKSKLTTLFDQATGSNYAEIAGQIANVALASAAFLNPFTILDATDAMLEVRDRQANLVKSFVDREKLDVISKYLPPLKKFGDQLQSKIKVMASKFPSIRKLVRKAMRLNVTEQDITKISLTFLREYDSYRPAFEISTINEYDSLLNEIIDELCNIIYKGSSLVSAVAQGVIASEDTCLATKLDVRNLMGLYRDMYDKQDSIFHAFASAIRTTIARQNAANIGDISRKMNMGEFEISETNYRMAALEIIVNTDVNTLFLMHDACTLLEYKNAGVTPEYCKPAMNNPLAGLYSNTVIASKFDKDMCESDSIEKLVYIPVQQQSITSNIPKGAIDLTSLYRGYEVTFQIPNNQWLIDNNWIYEDDKNKMIVLQKFELFIPHNGNSSIYVKSATRYLSKNIIRPGGKVYHFNTPNLYQYNFRYSQGGEFCSMSTLLSTPYELQSCPKLPPICILSSGETKNSAAYPSVYSKFGIKLSTVGRIQEPKPKTDFFLMASVKICLIDPVIGRKPNKKRGRKMSKHYDLENTNWKQAACCGTLNQYHDRLSTSQKCKPCPSGSTPRLGGYYFAEIKEIMMFIHDDFEKQKNKLLKGKSIMILQKFKKVGQGEIVNG